MTTEKFHWTTPAGADIALPYMSRLPVGLLRRVRKLEEMDGMFTILEEICDAETLAKVDGLEVKDLESLATAWQTATASLGESGGSSI